MKRIKKLVAGILGMLLSISLFSGVTCMEVRGEISPCTIRQELNVSSCKQGDTVTLSVYLQGSEESWSISSLKGELEYDTSLFTVEKADVLPAQSSYVGQKSFDKSSGVFRVTYNSNIVVYNKTQVIQLRLHVNEKATTGKTTVCVTNLTWQASDGTGKNEVEHRVPSSITISAAEKPKEDEPVEEEPGTAGDVNLDGKVTLTDAKVIMQYCNKAKKLSTRQKKNADVNGDGKVNLADAKLVMKYCNGETDASFKPKTSTPEKTTQTKPTSTNLSNKKSVIVTLTTKNRSYTYDFLLKKAAKMNVKITVLDVSGKAEKKEIIFGGIWTNIGKSALFYDLKTSSLKKGKTFTSSDLAFEASKFGDVTFELPKGMKKLKIKVTFSTVNEKKLIQSLKLRNK